MITHSALYWITRLDPLKSMLCGFSITLGIIGLGLLITGIIFKAICLDNMSNASDDGAEKIHQKYISRHAWIFRSGVKAVVAMFALILLNTFTPTMKEAAVIVVIPKVANSQPVQDIGEGIVNLAKDWMKELSPKNLTKEEMKSKVVNTANAVAKTASQVEAAVKSGTSASKESK